MAKITLESEEFTLKITATKRELLELADMVSQRLDADRYTSGDNPAWGFLTNLECILEGIDAK